MAPKGSTSSSVVAKKGMKNKKSKQNSQSETYKRKKKSAVAAQNEDLKNRKRSLSTSNSQLSQVSKRKKRPEEPEVIKNIHVSAKAQSSWKPLPPTTIQYVTGLMDANISHVVSHAPQEYVEAVHHLLHKLRHRIASSLGTLKAPKAVTNYNHLHSMKNALEEKIENNTDQIKIFDEMIKEEERLINERISKIERLKERNSAGDYKDNEELHPLLRAPTLNLDIPPIPANIQRRHPEKVLQIKCGSKDKMKEFLSHYAKINDGLMET